MRIFKIWNEKDEFIYHSIDENKIGTYRKDKPLDVSQLQPQERDEFFLKFMKTFNTIRGIWFL